MEPRRVWTPFHSYQCVSGSHTYTGVRSLLSLRSVLGVGPSFLRPTTPDPTSLVPLYRSEGHGRVGTGGRERSFGVLRRVTRGYTTDPLGRSQLESELPTSDYVYRR